MRRAPIEIINTEHVEANYISASEHMAELIVYPRVHMFTFDLSLISGVLKHGSMGRSLTNMPVSVKAMRNYEKKDTIAVYGGTLQVENLDFKVDFDKLRRYIGSNDHYSIEIQSGEFPKEHIGLGLSTQILGAIYLCSARISGRSLGVSDLFMLGIGHFSALGLNLLFNPGMILEMGVKLADSKKGLIVNPELSGMHEVVANTVMKVNDFPFYTIVAVPLNESSISGEYEIEFWNKSLPDRDEDSYRIVYNVLESIVPSIVERDFTVFSNALNQNISLGSKPLEESVQSGRTKEVLAYFRKEFGFAAISSLGPALYSFSENDPREELRHINVDDYRIFVYDPLGRVKQKINNNESVLIASFACMGKSTFAKENPGVALDIESIHYARIYDNKHPNDEVAKGDANWRPNPDYPANYVKEVIDNIGKYKLIFLTGGKDILLELDKLGIKYSILYPGESRKNKVLDDARRRGNNNKFIKLLDDLLSTRDHLLGFKSLNYERLDIIDDERYIGDYVRERYYI